MADGSVRGNLACLQTRQILKQLFTLGCDSAAYLEEAALAVRAGVPTQRFLESVGAGWPTEFS